MKKLMTLFAAILFAVSAFAFSGGDGSVDNPYLISTAADFNDLRTADAQYKYFEVTTDIDMSSYDASTVEKTFYPILKGTTPVIFFLDGKGFAIKNLKVVRTTGTATNNKYIGVVGVFGFGTDASNPAYIKNLEFDGITVNSEDASSILWAGIVIGKVANNGAQVSNCKVVDSSVKGGTSGSGAIVGWSAPASGKKVEVSNCYVGTDVTITGVKVGGIVGKDQVAGSSYTHCAFYGTTVGSTSIAPVVNTKNANNTYSQCYYTNDITYNNTVGGTLLLGADVKDLTKYIGFSTDTWVMGSEHAELKSFPTAEASATSNITYVNMETIAHSNPATFTDVETVTLAEPSGKKTGYAFVGWFNDEAFTSPVSTPAIPLGTTTDKTFYAKWVAVTVSNITYENMGTVTHTNPASFHDAEELTLLAPTGDSTASEFAGWYLDADFITPVATPAIAIGTIGDKTFYAKWTPVFVVTGMTFVSGAEWNNVTNMYNLEENSTVTLRLEYANPQGEDTVYFCSASKDSWTTAWTHKKVGFPVGETTVDVQFTVRAWANSFDPDRSRIWLSATESLIWTDRYDLENPSDDAYYYDIVEEGVFTALGRQVNGFTSPYPNPTTGLVNIELPSLSQVQMYSISGQRVFSSTLAEGKHTIDVSSYARGIYILSVAGGGMNKTERIILK